MKNISLIIFSFFILSCADKDKNTENKIAISKNSDTTTVFTWTTELCENKGTYNTKTYSEAELKNTYDLWFAFSGVAFGTYSNPRSIEDIDKLNTYKLMSEYIDKKALLNRKIVSTPFWNKLKEERLQELEDEYELEKITIEAYTNPGVLLNNKYSKHCPEYAQVLSSNDTIALLNSWRNLIEQQKSTNGAPEKLMERYNQKYNSKDRLIYAKIELMTYGWWNCANSEIRRVDNDGTLEKEFNKLFLHITTECDEP